jgi:hypothetical protein
LVKLRIFDRSRGLKEKKKRSSCKEIILIYNLNTKQS